MAIPPEIEQLIPQVRKQYPQLANLPDEVVAQMILEAIHNQETEPSVGEQSLDKMAVEGCDVKDGASPGYVGIGGYWRYTSDDGHDDAWKYFDDIYIDNTLSRVMLGNSSNYSNCTIIEPQIPSAWVSNRITCTVNLGKLADSETAYVFVFDADNNHNPVGYPVTIGGGGGGDAPPNPPTGVGIVGN